MSNWKLKKYLPDGIGPGLWPERSWYWGVAATVVPFWCTEYKKQVVDQRRNKKQAVPEKKNLIKISDKWLKKLLEHDYETKGMFKLFLFINTSLQRKYTVTHRRFSTRESNRRKGQERRSISLRLTWISSTLPSQSDAPLLRMKGLITISNDLMAPKSCHSSWVLQLF